MCIHGHPESARSEYGDHRCLLCHKLAQKRYLDNVPLPARYKLNKKLFCELVPRGKRFLVLGLCGLDPNSYWHWLNKPHFKCEGMGLLAARLHVPFLKLWKRTFPERNRRVKPRKSQSINQIAGG